MSFEHRRSTMHRTIILVAVSTIISAALATASVAQAAGPVHERVAVDDSFTWDDCGFTVEERLVGTLHFASWYDDAGNRTRQIVTAPGARITWTNTETGASVTSASPYAVHKTDNPDGSLTVAFTGLSFALNGGGRAYVSSGRALVLFTEDGVEFLAGSGPSADLCEALTATIG
jgi:hypothetical protein